MVYDCETTYGLHSLNELATGEERSSDHVQTRDIRMLALDAGYDSHLPIYYLMHRSWVGCDAAT